jgi:hypothetical protein
MAERRPAACTLILAGLMLPLVWLLLPFALPLYDGLTLPPEPYRYLQPTSKQARNNLLPTTARSTVAARNAPYITISTHEQPPQAEIVLAGNAFHARPGMSHVTISIRAVPPPPIPEGMLLVGNVYAISAAAAGRPVALRQGGAVVVLRSTTLYRRPLMMVDRGRAWERLYASPGYHTASWAAQTSTLGDFALMVKGQSRSSTSSSTSRAPFLIAAVAVLLIAAVALFLLRRALSRRTI